MPPQPPLPPTDPGKPHREGEYPPRRPAPAEPVIRAWHGTPAMQVADAWRFLKGLLLRQRGLGMPAEEAGKRAGRALETPFGLAMLVGSPRALAQAARAMPPRLYRALQRRPETIGVAEPVPQRWLGAILGWPHARAYKHAAAVTTNEPFLPLRVPRGARVTIIPTKEWADDPRVWAHEGGHVLYYLKGGGETMVPPAQHAARIAAGIGGKYPGMVSEKAIRSYRGEVPHLALDVMAQNMARRAGMPYRSFFGEPTAPGAARGLDVPQRAALAPTDPGVAQLARVRERFGLPTAPVPETAVKRAAPRVLPGERMDLHRALAVLTGRPIPARAPGPGLGRKRSTRETPEALADRVLRDQGGFQYLYETARELYRQQARRAHPDLGGDPALMRQLNAAMDYIERHYGPGRATAPAPAR